MLLAKFQDHRTSGSRDIVRLMDFKQGLDRTKNTPIVLKAK